MPPIQIDSPPLCCTSLLSGTVLVQPINKRHDNNRLRTDGGREAGAARETAEDVTFRISEGWGGNRVVMNDGSASVRDDAPRASPPPPPSPKEDADDKDVIRQHSSGSSSDSWAMLEFRCPSVDSTSCEHRHAASHACSSSSTSSACSAAGTSVRASPRDNDDGTLVSDASPVQHQERSFSGSSNFGTGAWLMTSPEQDSPASVPRRRHDEIFSNSNISNRVGLLLPPPIAFDENFRDAQDSSTIVVTVPRSTFAPPTTPSSSPVVVVDNNNNNKKQQRKKPVGFGVVQRQIGSLKRSLKTGGNGNGSRRRQHPDHHDDRGRGDTMTTPLLPPQPPPSFADPFPTPTKKVRTLLLAGDGGEDNGYGFFNGAGGAYGEEDGDDPLALPTLQLVPKKRRSFAATSSSSTRSRRLSTASLTESEEESVTQNKTTTALSGGGGDEQPPRLVSSPPPTSGGGGCDNSDPYHNSNNNKNNDSTMSLRTLSSGTIPMQQLNSGDCTVVPDSPPSSSYEGEQQTHPHRRRDDDDDDAMVVPFSPLPSKPPPPGRISKQRRAVSDGGGGGNSNWNENQNNTSNNRTISVVTLTPPVVTLTPRRRTLRELRIHSTKKLRRSWQHNTVSASTIIQNTGERIGKKLKLVKRATRERRKKLPRPPRRAIRLPKLPPRRSWLIPADHPIKVTWDVITVLLSMLSAFLTHQSIRDRDYDRDQYGLIRFCEIWFFVDILLNFVTQHRSGRKVLCNVEAVWLRYLTTWFIVDALSFLPWEKLYVKPIVEMQKRRNVIKKFLRRSKVGFKVTRMLRGRHIKWFGTVAKHSKQVGVGTRRLIQLLIRYIPKYVVFVKHMRSVLVVRLLRQIHWFRKVSKNLYYKFVDVEPPDDGDGGGDGHHNHDAAEGREGAGNHREGDDEDDEDDDDEDEDDMYEEIVLVEDDDDDDYHYDDDGYVDERVASEIMRGFHKMYVWGDGGGDGGANVNDNNPSSSTRITTRRTTPTPSRPAITGRSRARSVPEMLSSSFLKQD